MIINLKPFQDNWDKIAKWEAIANDTTQNKVTRDIYKTCDEKQITEYENLLLTLKQ